MSSEAIRESGRLPLEIADRETDQVFFSISSEQYNLARRLLDGVEDIDPSLYEIEDIELTDAK